LVLTAPAVAQAADPYRNIVVSTPTPYWGYSYAPYVVRNALDGIAEIIRAQGDFLVKTQEASLLREEVRQKKFETRRKELEHWEWERDFMVSWRNKDLERLRKSDVEYSRKFPQYTEIYAGMPLNSLFDELRSLPDYAADNSVPVAAEWLDHINVTVDGRSNLGLLKNGKVLWPQGLLRADYNDDREAINQLLTKAKENAVISQSQNLIDAVILRQLRERVGQLRERLDREFKGGAYQGYSWTWSHYIGTMRFLRQVSDSIYALEQPGAAVLLNPLQGKTVAELVGYMKKNGVRFAAATLGGEAAYVALHRALADEVTRVQGKQSDANK
jgi:hypothetical protein